MINALRANAESRRVFLEFREILTELLSWVAALMSGIGVATLYQIETIPESSIGLVLLLGLMPVAMALTSKFSCRYRHHLWFGTLGSVTSLLGAYLFVPDPSDVLAYASGFTLLLSLGIFLTYMHVIQSPTIEVSEVEHALSPIYDLPVDHSIREYYAMLLRTYPFFRKRHQQIAEQKRSPIIAEVIASAQWLNKQRDEMGKSMSAPDVQSH